MEDGEGYVNVTYRTSVNLVLAPRKIGKDDAKWTENGYELYKIERQKHQW